MRLIAPLAGLLLAASCLPTLAQTAPATPPATTAPATTLGSRARPAGHDPGRTPARPEVQISRPIEMILTQQAATMALTGDPSRSPACRRSPISAWTVPSGLVAP